MKTRALLLAIAMIVLIVWSWCAIQLDEIGANDPATVHAPAGNASEAKQAVTPAVVLSAHQAPADGDGFDRYRWGPAVPGASLPNDMAASPPVESMSTNPPTAQLVLSPGPADLTEVRNDLAPESFSTMPQIIRPSESNVSATPQGTSAPAVRRLPPVAGSPNANDPDVQRLPTIEVVDIPVHRGVHEGVVRLPPVDQEVEAVSSLAAPPSSSETPPLGRSDSDVAQPSNSASSLEAAAVSGSSDSNLTLPSNSASSLEAAAVSGPSDSNLTLPSDSGSSLEAAAALPSELPEIGDLGEEDAAVSAAATDNVTTEPLSENDPFLPPLSEPVTSTDSLPVELPPADVADDAEVPDAASELNASFDPYAQGFPVVPDEPRTPKGDGHTTNEPGNEPDIGQPAASPASPQRDIAEETLPPQIEPAAEPLADMPLDPQPASNAGPDRPWFESSPDSAAAAKAGVSEPVSPSYASHPTPPAVGSTPEQSRQALDAIRPRLQGHIRHGMNLAERRAFYSARTEFIGALRLLAQSLDAQTDTAQRGQALDRGLWAIEEADDFITQDDGLGAGPNVQQLITVHRTTVLKSQSGQATALRAIQAYYTYAQEQLAEAVKPVAEGSQALSALGKLYVEIDKEPTRLVADPRTKGLAFQQAALLVDPNNAQAANELGVLLAREGRHAEARDWLRHSATLLPQRETWHNLAVVHTRLGEPRLAEVARQQSLAVAQRDAQRRLFPGGSTRGVNVQQVTPAEFSGMTPKPTVDSRTSQPQPRAARRTSKPSGGLWNWLNKPWR